MLGESVGKFCSTAHSLARGLGAALTLAGVLVGCETTGINGVSIREVMVPEINGKLHRSGVPVPGVVIKVSRNEGVRSVCERPVLETITDQQGLFRLEAVASVGTPSVPDRIENDWQVCMEETSAVRQLWFDRHVGVLTSENMTELDCDIDRARRINSAFCNAKNVEKKSAIPD